ncbi:MAG: hypothetical protein C0433_09955 [Cyclobacterium sp.]|nr:hypothetical protein [Cyclobacterium sp.]
MIEKLKNWKIEKFQASDIFDIWHSKFDVRYYGYWLLSYWWGCPMTDVRCPVIVVRLSSLFKIQIDGKLFVDEQSS